MNFGRFTALGMLAVLLCTAPATAEISEFYGVWSNGAADASGIARLVIAPGDGARVSIHLYGRCLPVACDWGVQPARTYSDDPGASEVRGIAADFAAGGAHRRIVLRTAIGHALRFDVQTDFAPGTNRRNFATSGVVAYAGDWTAAARLAEVAPPPPSPTGGGAPVPLAELAPPSRGAGGPTFLGLGPAAASGYAPAAGEDCRPYDPEQVRVGIVDGRWRIGDFANRLLDFGPHQEAARRAKLILDHYHFDEQCFVTHNSSAMIYWKRAGRMPDSGVQGEDCTAFETPGVTVVQNGDGWRVVAGAVVLLDYDAAGDAARAASVIRAYKLNRQCFFARRDSSAQYWLAR